MLLTDLREVKKVLEIDGCDASEDARLHFFIEWASNIIEELLSRPGLSYASRTEYYGGTGSQKLLLRSRPVFTTPTIRVFLDESAFYGSASGAFDPQNTELTFGTDFCLDIDQDDGSSRSGILVRINDFWPKPSVRQGGYLSPFIGQGFGTIKVIYTAGYTVDTLPPAFRAACNLLVAKMRYIFPLGMEIVGDGYEEKSLSFAPSQIDYLKGLVKPLILPYKNWKW